MIMNRNSLALRVLMFVWSPTQYLPPLFPLWVMPARVGTNYVDYVQVTFRRPK